MIDIGSNTIRMVVYRVTDGTLHPVLNKKYATGLVSYINGKGRMSKEGIHKAVEILRELKEVAGQIHLQEVFPFATASLRNITNTEEVRQAIQAGTGFSVRVLSGQEEATFDYYAPFRAHRRPRACSPTWAAAAQSWSSFGTGLCSARTPSPSAPSISSTGLWRAFCPAGQRYERWRQRWQVC